MNEYDFRKIYIGEYQPDPWHKLSNDELRAIEQDKHWQEEDRRRAKRIRMDRYKNMESNRK